MPVFAAELTEAEVQQAVDAQGKEISNSPEVTLKLVAGPGEFPMVSSITFK